MFEGLSEDNRFFKALDDFVQQMKSTFTSDFHQGFIKESEYQRLLHLMLRNPHMERGAGFGNMVIKDNDRCLVKIEDDKLYINYAYFKREADSKLSSPYAIFIKNSNKPVRYYNYYVDHSGNFSFKQQQDLVEIMSDYGLTKEEAAEYEKMMRDEPLDLKEEYSC
jgi:hypothetical protein